MRSEFEETLKQHKDSLTDELEQLSKHRQAQLVEWDIEQNESNYEFYFNAGWNAQQSKVDELQKRVDAAYDVLTELKEMSEALHHRWQIFSDSIALAESEMIDMCVKELEQALNGGESK
ncbi:hypothetical protein [Acinetobacter venetianus]|uniref:hypothetical protein n=1 Tax=Acinetobacter venetianus TaxID=52133 RepID=UPI00077822AA|nr:hypothetical protein [Acinetobacter venetianus]KXZ65595.1 hypothetical protein AVENLUH7437_01372 [Acinetobacter venetianus]